METLVLLRRDRLTSDTKTPGGASFDFDDDEFRPVFIAALSGNEIYLPLIRAPITFDDKKSQIREVTLCDRLTDET